MDIPLYVFAILYVVIVIVVAVVGILNIGLALRFGLRSFGAGFATVLFLISFAVVTSLTVFSLRDVDWSSGLSFSLPSTSIPNINFTP